MIEISKLTQKITHRHYKTIFILTLVLSTRKNNVKKLHFSCNERYFHSPMNHLLVRKHFPVYNCISFSISPLNIQNFVNYHCCRSVRYKKSIFLNIWIKLQKLVFGSLTLARAFQIFNVDVLQNYLRVV